MKGIDKMIKHKMISKITSGVLLCTILAYTAPVFAYTKDETIYSKLNANGNSYQTIVNNHIENSENSKLINDLSNLLNIKNVHGDETFEQTGNTLVWNANGNDIYYQGETQKKLPIECKIKYVLDGKQITPQELAGKSGKVKITIEYSNKDKHTININGKSETMYTPFVVVCGTILNNDNNKNIKITNGKRIDDGSKTTLVGISLPGLQESLGISKNKLEIPNTIEITMDSMDFELSNIVTIVTPKLIENNDLNLFDQLDDIYSQINNLQSASKQLVNGSSQLKKGSRELNNGATELKKGITTAKNGAKQIKTEVEKSVKTLKADKSEAIDNKTLSSIKKQAENAALKTYNAQESTIKKQAENIALKTYNTQESAIKRKAKTSVDNMFANPDSNSPIAKGIQTNATELITQLSQLKGSTLTLQEQQAIINTLQKTALLTAEETAQMTAATTAKETAVTTAASTATTTAKETAITTATTTATTVAKEVGNQAKQQFTKQVVSQMGTLSDGLGELVTGLEKLDNGAKALTSGTTTLNKGINTLSNGMNQFHKEGIQSICNYVNEDVKSITTRLEKLQELAKEYNNFTMLNKDHNGSVKFIMIIDSIKKENNRKEEMIIEENSQNSKDQSKEE